MPNFDPGLLARVSASGRVFTGYRHQTRERDPISGEGAFRQGGRFNPPNSFPVVYLCTTTSCAKAEFRRLATLQEEELEKFLPRDLWEIGVTTQSVLDLTDPSTRKQISISETDLVGNDYSITHQLGFSANSAGLHAILSPSATGRDDILAILRANINSTDMHPDLLATWYTIEDLQPIP